MQSKQDIQNKNTKILPFLKPYWYLALLAPLFMVGEVLCDLMQPTLMSRIVDEGVFKSDMQFILTTGMRMLIIAICGGIAGVASAGFGGAASQSLGNDLRKAVYNKIMHLSIEQTDRFTTGSLITRLTNDVSMIQNLTEMALRMFVRSPMMFMGGIVMAVTLNVNFALVLIISLPIQLLVLWLILSKAGPLFSIVQKKLDKVNSVVQENVTGARVVKAYVKESYEEERFDKANSELVERNLKVQKLIAILNPVLMIVMNISVIAIIYIGGLQVQAGALQVGKVMAAVTYVTQVLMSIMMVSMMFQSISRGRASAERIREVLSTEPVITDKENAVDFVNGDIVFENVSFAYPSGSGREVLTNVNLSIKQGETVAILGATGAGKTSLVSLLMRLYDCTSGRVTVAGEDIRNISIDKLRSSMGMVLQKSELFSGSIREQLMWGKDNASEEEMMQAMSVAQADEFIGRFEDGIDSEVGEKGSALSGGQKQRVSIARALVRKPDIMIMDDSTSALDLGTESRLRTALAESCAGMTVILIAQRVASARTADKIAVLDKGTIAAVGTHDELMQSCGVYVDIYNSQNKKEGQ